MNINNDLNKLIDIKYLEFNRKICKSHYPMLGIKIPLLKELAKKYLKQYDYKDILNNLKGIYYEEIILEGLIISYSIVSYDERIILIDNYISKIDCWAICDTFCSSLKFINKNKDLFLNHIEEYLKKDDEYYLRFYVVILLDYYICDQYIDYVLYKLKTINSDYYYVKMAISWCISVCLIKYFDKTVGFLKTYKNDFNTWTYNKGIQKALESFRICQKDKIILKNMKI